MFDLRSRLLSTMSRLKPTGLAGRWIEDNRGIAAIEFAMIAPFMIAFYFGLSEVSIAISADRNVAHAASVAGDLATQASSLDKVQIEEVMATTLAVLGVNHAEASSDVTIELNSYSEDADGNETLVGYARLGPKISAGGPETFDPSILGPSMLSNTSGAVVARINVNYKTVTGAFIKKVTLNETFALKPRKSLTVPFGESGTTSYPNCSVQSNMTVKC